MRGLLLLGIVLLTALSAAGRAVGSPVATIAMIAEPLGIRSLMGSGTDPHLYKLTRSDAARLIGASHLLHNGLGLEGKMLDAFERLAKAGRPVMAVAEAVPVPDRIAAAPGYPDAHDPHVWMDPVLWERSLNAAAAFVGRETAVDFSDLDAYARRTLATIPEPARILVTAHDAFRYFGRRYGLEVIGIQGLSTDAEAGLKAIEETVALVVARKIPAVFVESTVSGRNVGAIVSGTAARGHRTITAGPLFSDAMGPAGTYEGTYVGMIDHNVTVITRALGGIAPEGGMQGRLTLHAH